MGASPYPQKKDILLSFIGAKLWKPTIGTVLALASTISFLGCVQADTTATTTPPTVQTSSTRIFTPDETRAILILVTRLDLEARARSGDREAIKQLIRDEFGPQGDWAVRIATRESGLQPGVHSRTGCMGLFELALPLHRRLFEALGLDWRATWADPVANIQAAHLLYLEDGPGPWRL